MYYMILKRDSFLVVFQDKMCGVRKVILTRLVWGVQCNYPAFNGPLNQLGFSLELTVPGVKASFALTVKTTRAKYWMDVDIYIVL